MITSLFDLIMFLFYTTPQIGHIVLKALEKQYMNIQTISHILILFSFSCIQSMELSKATNNTPIYPKNLHLDKSLITTLITMNAKNEFHRPFACTREKRLKLLQELIYQEAHITFENNGPNRTLWIQRQEPTIHQGVFYDAILSFFSEKKFSINHASSQQPKAYTHTLWLNSSFLYIEIARPVKPEIAYALDQFLREYNKNQQYIPNFYQEICDDEDDLFTGLPEATQEFLDDICNNLLTIDPM